MRLAVARPDFLFPQPPTCPLTAVAAALRCLASGDVHLSAARERRVAGTDLLLDTGIALTIAKRRGEKVFEVGRQKLIGRNLEEGSHACCA
jgi:hypothetical protein